MAGIHILFMDALKKGLNRKLSCEYGVDNFISGGTGELLKTENEKNSSNDDLKKQVLLLKDKIDMLEQKINKR